MSTAIRIEGLDECLRSFDRLPENALRITEAAMKEAGQPVAKKIRSLVPKEFRRLIKVKVIKAERRLDGNSTVIIGAFKRKRQSELEISDWNKMYWQNYGTLTRRDPGHEFVFPVKKDSHSAAKRRRNRVGQPHLNFFDNAIRGWEQMIYDNFVAALKKRENDLLK